MGMLVPIVVLIMAGGASGMQAGPDISGDPAGTDIHGIFKTPSGEYYIATNNGLSLWIGPGKYRNYTIYDGLVSNLVYDIAEDDKGRLWIATEGGISILEDGRFVNFPCGPGFVQSGVISLKWKNRKMEAHTVSDGVLIFEGDLVRQMPTRKPEPALKKSKKRRRGRFKRPYRRPRKPTLEISAHKIDYEKGEWKKVLGEGIPALYPMNYRRHEGSIKPPGE